MMNGTGWWEVPVVLANSSNLQMGVDGKETEMIMKIVGVG